MIDRPRIRNILKAASKLTSDPTVVSWLVCDEQGTWERMVEGFLNSPLNSTPTKEEVDDAITSYIALQAMDAVIRNRKKDR
jgi:hypothetical protein